METELTATTDQTVAEEAIGSDAQLPTLDGISGARRRSILPIVPARADADERSDRSRSPRLEEPDLEDNARNNDDNAVADPYSEDGENHGVVQASARIASDELVDVHADVAKVITSLSTELAQNIDSLQRTNEKLAKLEMQLESLNQGRVPNGIAPFKPGAVSKHSGKTFCEIDMRFETTIKANSTYLDAKKAAYAAYQAMLVQIDQSMHQKVRTEQRVATRRSTFVDTCKAKAAAYTRVANTLDLDLEDTSLTVNGTDPQHVASRATRIWQRIVDKATARKVRAELASAKRKQSHEAVVEKLASQPPKEWLNAAIDARLKSRSKGTQPDYAAMYTDRPEMPEKETLAQFVDENIPKNYLSPEGARGGKAKGRGKGSGKSNPSPKAKAKAKGKASPAPASKGKAKGKGKPGGKGGNKGKGRGKGKGKT